MTEAEKLAIFNRVGDHAVKVVEKMHAHQQEPGGWPLILATELLTWFTAGIEAGRADSRETAR